MPREGCTTCSPGGKLEEGDERRRGSEPGGSGWKTASNAPFAFFKRMFPLVAILSDSAGIRMLKR